MTKATKLGLYRTPVNRQRLSIENQILNFVNGKRDVEIGRRRSNKTGAMLRLLYSGTHDCFIFGTEPNLDPEFKYNYRTSDTRDVTIIKRNPAVDTEIAIDNVRAMWLDFVGPHKTTKEEPVKYLKRFIFSDLEEMYLSKEDRARDMGNNLVISFNAKETEFTISKNIDDLPPIVKYKRKVRCYEDYVIVLTEIGYEIQSISNPLNRIIIEGLFNETN